MRLNEIYAGVPLEESFVPEKPDYDKFEDLFERHLVELRE